MARTHTGSRLHGPHLARLLAVLAVPLGGGIGCSSSVPTDGSTADQAGFDEVVYVVRQHTVVTGSEVNVTVADGMGQVMDYGRYVPGARVEVRSLVNRDVRNILEGTRYAKADVEGMDLSFDAKKIVFSMKLDGGDNYHVYTANLAKGKDANNPYGIQQLTAGAYDDMTPIWMAGSRVAFVTNQGYTEMGTRADEYNHGRRVTQIATVSEVGGDSDRKVCSQNLSHTFNPFRMQSGQIGFSRWEHLENVNDSKLFAMNPDCTKMIALAGQHDKPANSLVQVAETAERNVFVAVGTDRENTIQAGALIQVDARSAGSDTRHDEERAQFTVLTSGVPRGMDPSPIGRYRSPHVLPDGRLLVSWSDGIVNDLSESSLTPPDFGIYIYDPADKHGKNHLVYDAEGTWELYAQPVTPHAEPPQISSIQNSQDTTIPMVIGSIDVRRTSLGTLHNNTVSGAQFAPGTSIDEALKQAVKVRILEGFSSEAAPNVTMFGLTMAEGSAILGEAPVLSDGSWRAKVPPFIPMHLQAVDQFDLAIRSQTTWIQGMPGEDRVCGGCHEERTAPNSPSAQQLTLAASETQDFMKAIVDRTEYPWFQAAASATEVQKILDAKCVSCHNDTTNGSGPQEHYSVTMTDKATGVASTYQLDRMNLSTREVTVRYDRRTASYPMSYVSIFYPAALAMEKGVTVVGTVPPKWGVPSDARGSLLIEKLNITSAFDETVTAWPLDQPYSDSDPPVHGAKRTMHPDDVGVKLSREERVALIRAFDMGGQFYSRQNTGFVAYGNDAVGTPTYPQP
jgi:hypothetical protein